MDTPTVIVVIALSYMIGSFPTAYLVGKVKGINIFEHGSGNMGATNVLRTLGLFWAALVFITDIGKGVLAVWIARQLAPAEPLSTQASASVVAAVAVVAGHNWSVLATILTGSIHGGKGVATAGGAWFIMMPTLAVALPLLVVVLIIYTTRYMSLAAMTGAVVGSLIITIEVLMGDLPSVYLLTTLITLMIILRHRANIKRLLAGTESRVGERVQVVNK
jgi:glycerol-3-phosphate acyltransferase PlsY